MLITPWSPHLKLPGRPHKESLCFAQIHLDCNSHNHTEPEVRVTQLGDAEQRTQRELQEFRGDIQPGPSSSCAAADTSLHIPDPQTPKPARQLSPAQREDSTPKRQRPAEVNTVLAITRPYSGMHCAHGRSESPSICTNFWCGGGGRRTAIATSSLDTVGIKTTTGRITQKRKLWQEELTNSQFRCIFCGNPTTYDFARTSHDRCT